MSDFPISRLYELGRLGQAGDEVAIEPAKDDLARIAQWADVEAVETFTAKIRLQKVTPTHFKLDAALDAAIVQNCVVTLEPVKSHIERAFTRELFLTPEALRAVKDVELDVAPVDEDGREEIASLRYDLAVPVLEEMVLALDPYPRAPGVAFEPLPQTEDEPVHPFAALKSLKET